MHAPEREKMRKSEEREQQSERTEVLEAMAESVAQLAAGQTQDARPAVLKLLDELKAE